LGCHGSTGAGFNASWTSSEVKPSPMEDELGGCFVGDEGAGVGEKKAWIELSLCEFAMMVHVK
jgi:hypothetical protein